MSVQPRAGAHTTHTLNGSSGFIDCTLSADIEVGDLVIINCHINSLATDITAETLSTAAQWGAVSDFYMPIASVRTKRFWKIATADDVGAVVRLAGVDATGGGWGANATVWHGHDPTTPIDVASQGPSPSDSQVLYTGLTPTVDGCTLLTTCALGMELETTLIHEPTGQTKVNQYRIDGGTDASLRIGSTNYEVLAGGADTAIADKTSTIDAGTTLDGAGGMIAIAPAEAGPTNPTAVLSPDAIIAQDAHPGSKSLTDLQRDVL